MCDLIPAVSATLTLSLLRLCTVLIGILTRHRRGAVCCCGGAGVGCAIVIGICSCGVGARVLLCVADAQLVADFERLSDRANQAHSFTLEIHTNRCTCTTRATSKCSKGLKHQITANHMTSCWKRGPMKDAPLTTTGAAHATDVCVTSRTCAHYVPFCWP